MWVITWIKAKVSHKNVNRLWFIKIEASKLVENNRIRKYATVGLSFIIAFWIRSSQTKLSKKARINRKYC